MAISRFTTGEYLGYTYGREKPTLYFENGHYTQVHDLDHNVGWHPNHDQGHQRVNINKHGQARYLQIPVGDLDGVQGFVEEVKKGHYDPYSKEDPEAALFEFDGSGKDHTHLSGGKFISRDAPGGSLFDDTYIDDVLRHGHWAFNEYGKWTR